MNVFPQHLVIQREAILMNKTLELLICEGPVHIDYSLTFKNIYILDYYFKLKFGRLLVTKQKAKKKKTMRTPLC